MTQDLIGVDKRLLYKPTNTPTWLKAISLATLFAAVIGLWFFLIVGVLSTNHTKEDVIYITTFRSTFSTHK